MKSQQLKNDTRMERVVRRLHSPSIRGILADGKTSVANFQSDRNSLVGLDDTEFGCDGKVIQSSIPIPTLDRLILPNSKITRPLQEPNLRGFGTLPNMRVCLDNLQQWEDDDKDGYEPSVFHASQSQCGQRGINRQPSVKFDIAMPSLIFHRGIVHPLMDQYLFGMPCESYSSLPVPKNKLSYPGFENYIHDAGEYEQYDPDRWANLVGDNNVPSA